MNPTWSPNNDDLQRAVLLLQALRDPRRPDHTQALHSLEVNANIPEFILHILFIFTHGNQYAITVDLRQLSGLIIKNFIFPKLFISEPVITEIIQQNLLLVLGDPQSDLRKTAAILIGKIAELFLISYWIDIFMQILSNITPAVLQERPELFDGCLLAVCRIVEDSSLKLSCDDVHRPLDLLVPQLLQLLSSSSPAVRLHALEAYNCLLYLLEGPNSRGVRSRNSSFDSQHSAVPGPPKSSPQHLHSPQHAAHAALSAQQVQGAMQPLIVHMHSFIGALSALCGDGDAGIRKTVCISITVISCLHIALLEPYMPSIIAFMLQTLLDEESVAMEGCEFFIVLCEVNTRSVLVPVLKELVANVLKRLYLTEEQMEAERIEEEEESTGAKQVRTLCCCYCCVMLCACVCGWGWDGHGRGWDQGHVCARW